MPAAAVSRARLREVSTRMLHSCVCRYADFLSPWYREWASRLGLPQVTSEDGRPTGIAHRKHWEYCAIAQALHERAMLEPGRVGCGFAVGQEPLPSAFASCGVKILATDQAREHSAESWVASGQHAASLDNVYMPALIDRSDFDAHVRFRPVDMRFLQLPWPESFDFIWSSCSLEHLGSLEAGWQFVLSSLELVKPGGFAIHTTEFNIASNDQTLMEGESVIYRRQDIEDLERRLRSIGCGLSEYDFFGGDDVQDIEFDFPPYYKNNRCHIKLLIHGHIATSFLLIIRKGRRADVPIFSDGSLRCGGASVPRARPDQSLKNLQNSEALKAELAAQRERNHSLRLQLSAICNSTSWRVTAPLRELKRLIVHARFGR